MSDHLKVKMVLKNLHFCINMYAFNMKKMYKN